MLYTLYMYIMFFLFCKWWSINLKNLFMATQHAGSVSLTRDQTQIPCSGSVEPYLLDLQGSPKKYFLKKAHKPTETGNPTEKGENWSCTLSSYQRLFALSFPCLFFNLLKFVKHCLYREVCMKYTYTPKQLQSEFPSNHPLPPWPSQSQSPLPQPKVILDLYSRLSLSCFFAIISHLMYIYY